MGMDPTIPAGPEFQSPSCKGPNLTRRSEVWPQRLAMGVDPPALAVAES